MRIFYLTIFFLLAIRSNGSAHNDAFLSGNRESIKMNAMLAPQQDTSRQDSTLKKAVLDASDQDKELADTLLDADDLVGARNAVFTDFPKKTMMESPEQVSIFPAVSLQQYLKGQSPGLYVQESSGEPGTVQEMFIRGTPMPLLSVKEVYQSQPLIVLDGIPLTSEHPFAFDIQQYDFNRAGPATNLSAIFDMDNIESIEVLKDLSGTAMYGPQGANGVIVIRSKQAGTRRQINVNVSMGAAQRPAVTTINGTFENAFRRQFYDRYTANGSYSNDDVYPLYLSDSLNMSYYGRSDWTDTYYGDGLVYNINANISGGTDRANFRFSLGNLHNEGIADGTSMDRYSTTFSINMKPLKWLLFSAVVNANRLERQRNRNLRDRFSLMSYLPDMQAPLAPNNEVYSEYIGLFDNSFDDNKSNVLNGYARLAFDFGRLKVTSQLGVDYNEGYRDLFYPRAIMENISFASNYYGFNQRLMFNNSLTYDVQLPVQHTLRLEAGQNLQWDLYKYNNAYAYRGVNDFIKLNLLESDPGNDSYLHPTAFPRELVYKFLDRTKQNQVSFFGRGSYNYQEKYTLSVLLRADASSNSQPTSRWLFTPVVSAGWNVKNSLLADNNTFNEFNIRASAGRQGRLNAFDNFSQGPQYTSDITYTGNVTAAGYNSFATLSRPYNFGWVGYEIPWAYTDQLSIGTDLAFYNNRLRVTADWYTKTDKNQLLGIPSYAEFGYSRSYEPGMSVNNTGVEMIVSADILLKDKNRLGWSSSLNINHNKNKLTALPRNLDEIVIEDRKLKVGYPVDQYWLLRNDGIYEADSDVPLVGGNPLRYNSIPLRAGDPIWRDVNGDQQINDDDRMLLGNVLPKVVGGFVNDLSYQDWSLNFNLYFNLGRNLINQEMANRFDFINREGNSNIESVKEITFWEKNGDYSKYPLYNPWSSVMPYRVEQDLFLENASFLKLRTVSLGYDLSTWLKRQNSKISGIYIYGSAHNLLTITGYSGRDPELVNYTGYDTGYGIPIPRTYTLGIKMKL